MLDQQFLQKIGFAEEDIPYILRCSEKYGDGLAQLAAAYISTLGDTELAVYPGDTREEAYTRAKAYAQAAIDRFPEEENPHILNLLAWLQLADYLHQRYAAHGLGDDVFYASLSDLPEKTKECRHVYGVCGVFSRWFFLFFDLKVFCLGRLYYEITGFEADSFCSHGLQLQRGDPVLSCHIPAKGKLTEEALLASLQQAYSFLGHLFPGTVMPVVCRSWLLWPPYDQKVFPQEGNLHRFVKQFSILGTESTGQQFPDCWRVFGKMYQGNTRDFPQDTTLRRSFIPYLNSQGEHGYGYGILLYDGQNQKIL